MTLSPHQSLWKGGRDLPSFLTHMAADWGPLFPRHRGCTAVVGIQLLALQEDAGQGGIPPSARRWETRKGGHGQRPFPETCLFRTGVSGGLSGLFLRGGLCSVLIQIRPPDHGPAARGPVCAAPHLGDGSSQEAEAPAGSRSRARSLRCVPTEALK